MTVLGERRRDRPVYPRGHLGVMRAQTQPAPLPQHDDLPTHPVDLAVGKAAACAIGRFLRLGAPPDWLRAPEGRP